MRLFGLALRLVGIHCPALGTNSTAECLLADLTTPFINAWTQHLSMQFALSEDKILLPHELGLISRLFTLRANNLRSLQLDIRTYADEGGFTREFVQVGCAPTAA